MKLILFELILFLLSYAIDLISWSDVDVNKYQNIANNINTC